MKVIFLGGISRAGKAAFWPLFSSLEYTDQPINLPNLDWFNTALLEGDISEDVFLQFVRLELHRSSWFSFLGRNINSNINDLTNFSRMRSKKELDERLVRNDDDLTFAQYNRLIDEHKFIPVFNTNIKLDENQQKKLGVEIVYIHVVRNPIRLYNEWIKTRRVERARSNSSRLINYKGKAAKEMSIENETADIIINEVSKYYHSVDSIKFENFCVDPKGTMHKISKKCDVNLRTLTPEKMKDANVPRDIRGEITLDLVSTNFPLSKDRIERLNFLQEKYFSDFRSQM